MFVWQTCDVIDKKSQKFFLITFYSCATVDYRELEKRYDHLKLQLNDFFRKIRVALGVESSAELSQQSPPSPDVLHSLSSKAAELAQVSQH